jgi:hypothetical protein
MKALFLIPALALLSPVLASAEGAAAASRGPAKAKYDTSTVVTLSGTVLGEARVDTGKSVKGVRLVLKTADGQVSVHLGPDTWVDKQKMKLAKGDEVTVRGSRFTHDGRPVVLAQSVVRGGETLVIRDESGKPAWAKSKG